jgi:Cu/Ag efflux pump CusA
VVKTAGEAVWASPLTYLNSSTPGSGGFIDTPNQRLGILHVSPIVSAKELAQIPVQGTTKALGDVAQVVESHQPLIGDAIINGKTGLMIVVEKFPDFNTADVTRGVERLLDNLRPGLPGVDIDTQIFRPASFLDRATSNLSWALLASLVLAVVAFWALMRSWRGAAVGFVSMAASLMTAALVLNALHVNFNMMVLAGLILAIGVIIDDAVIGLTAIGQALSKSERPAAEPRQSILSGLTGIRAPMIYATLILVIAVLPVLFMKGLLAAFFQPMILSYLIAVVASMAVALVVTPALAAFLREKGRPTDQDRFAVSDRMQRWLSADKLLIPAAALVICGIIATAMVVTQRDRSLIPTFKETDVLVELEMAPGTSLPAMTSATQKLMQELKKIPGVRNVAADIGRAQLSYEVADVNSGDVWVSIDPSAPYDATLAAIEKAVGEQKGLSASVETYLSKQMHERLTGEEDGLVVRLYGDDTSILRSKAEEIRIFMSQVKGVKKSQIEQREERDAIDVQVDLDKARAYGLKPGEVRRYASTLVAGITVGSLFQDQKVVDVLVWGAPNLRSNPDDIKNLPIETESGQLVKLSDVATVKTKPEMSIIRRQGVSRVVDIEAEISGRSVADVAQEIAAGIKGISFPFEYHAEVLGEHIERQSALNSMYSYVAASAVLIFLLLQAVFGSWRLAGLVLLGLPTAMLGGLLMMFLIKDISMIGALLGLFAVLAIALRNAIALIKHFQHLEYQEDLERTRAVSLGVEERFQSILTTAVVTACVFLPFVILGNSAGLEIAHPSALVILGGLITATLFNLLVVPALYARFGSGLPSIPSPMLELEPDSPARRPAAATRGARHVVS